MVVDTCISKFSSVEFPLFLEIPCAFIFVFDFDVVQMTQFFTLFLFTITNIIILSHTLPLSPSLFQYPHTYSHYLSVSPCFRDFPASNVPLFLHSITNSLFIQFFSLFNRWHKHTLDAIFHSQFSSHKTRMAEQKAELIESPHSLKSEDERRQERKCRIFVNWMMWLSACSL